MGVSGKESCKRAQCCGFTLIELAVVIVIIGLLIAGITVGMNLVRQSEMSSVISDMQIFQTAYGSFNKRYHAIPGDMTNASSYFDSCATTNSNCNGNGDGLITFNAGLPDESYSAWRELTIANLISNGVSEIPDGWTGYEVIDTTVPPSEISTVGYIMAGASTNFGTNGSSNATSPWSDGVTNAVFIAKVSSSNGLGNSALKPNDAFNIDAKIDDGAVNSGAFSGAQTGNFRSLTGVDATGNPCLSGSNYNLTVDEFACISGFALN